MIRLLLFNCFIWGLVTTAVAQKEDNIWLVGDAVTDVAMDSTWGTTVFDFSEDSVLFNYDSLITLDFVQTNATICNEAGELLFYTNGMRIINKAHEMMENGDSIAFGTQWLNNAVMIDGEWVPIGYRIIQGHIILPHPGRDSVYLSLYTHLEFDYLSALLSAEIDLSYNAGLGKVINKDVPIVEDSLDYGNVVPCRHANGRDWWLLMPNHDHRKVYTLLLDSTGIHLEFIQEFDIRVPLGVGQTAFSPDGTVLVSSEGIEFEEDGLILMLYDFDRCTGLLGNYREDVLSANGLGQGVAFSPSGRYLYVTNDLYLYQYDMEAVDVIASRELIAEYDGFEYVIFVEPEFKRPTDFGPMKLGPDGKIYVFVGGGQNRMLHVIEEPDKGGQACNFKQHHIELPTVYILTVPNIADFRLGPVDGSSCDTLGIDNLPVAKFRCVQDSIDVLEYEFLDLSYFHPTSWQWYVDGHEVSTEQNFSYTFPAPGTYEVCQAVSNSFAADTICKTVFIETNALAEIEGNDLVHIYPNPFVDQLWIRRHGGANLHYVEVHDIWGRVVLREELESEKTEINGISLKAGLYVYVIKDTKGRMVQTGKLVRI